MFLSYIKVGYSFVRNMGHIFAYTLLICTVKRGWWKEHLHILFCSGLWIRIRIFWSSTLGCGTGSGSALSKNAGPDRGA